MMLRFIFLFCCFFINAVPYVYNQDKSTEICLFISFDCRFCKQALLDLLAYLKKNPKVSVRIYYFPKNQDEVERSFFMLACSDIKQVEKMMNLALFEDKKNERNKFVQENKLKVERNQKLIQRMRGKFLEAQIGVTPCWLINNVFIIEGLIDIEKVIRDVRKISPKISFKK